MGTFLSTAVTLMLASCGTAGVELIMTRYATPEARSVERLPVLDPERSTRDPRTDDAAHP